MVNQERRFFVIDFIVTSLIVQYTTHLKASNQNTNFCFSGKMCRQWLFSSARTTPSFKGVRKGWVSLGLKSPIELDILQKLDYLGKGD